MMKTQHTPGPWVICIQDDDCRAYTIFAKSQLDKNGRIEAGEWDGDIATAGLNHDNYEANARLISAAPELLASLQVVLRDYAAVHDIGDVEMQPAIYQAHAAIAKATGGAA